MQKDDRYYNLIIVCLDALRPDHLGCYGYFRDTAPHIDELTKNGILFEWAIAQSTFTLPSHASLFTSKYIHSHKADMIGKHLSDKEITLAEVLKDNGYKTAAFIYNAIQFNPVFGLNQGFDVYDFGEEENKEPSFEKTMPEALKWIGQHKDNKFFVFLHSNDVHQPYHSPFENFFDPDYKGRLDNEYFSRTPSFCKNSLTRTPREIEHIVAHYDGGIRYADGFVGTFIQQIKDWGLLDKTIIILLADHGELLGEREKRFFHKFSVYDEEVLAPLIIIHPGIRKQGIRIHKQVQLIDVMPTVLDFLGIKGDNIGMEGRSLLNLIEGNEGEDFDKYVYAEYDEDKGEEEDIIIRKVMVRTSSWKLIGTWRIKKGAKEAQPKIIQLHNGAIISSQEEDGYELYDLKRDPKETKNLINQGHNKIVAELLERLMSAF